MMILPGLLGLLVLKRIILARLSWNSIVDVFNRYDSI
jgi:hypothetical protein